MAHAVPDNAKGGIALVVAVLRVKAVGFGFSDVPLRICRVGILTSRHADGAVHVAEVHVVLERNGLTRSAAAARKEGGGIHAHSRARGITGLGDEIVDDTMEKNAIVQALFDVLNHVFNGDRRPHREHLDDDLALLVALEVPGLIVHVDHEHRVPGVRVIHG